MVHTLKPHSVVELGIARGEVAGVVRYLGESLSIATATNRSVTCLPATNHAEFRFAVRHLACGPEGWMCLIDVSVINSGVKLADTTNTVAVVYVDDQHDVRLYCEPIGRATVTRLRARSVEVTFDGRTYPCAWDPRGHYVRQHLRVRLTNSEVLVPLPSDR